MQDIAIDTHVRVERDSVISKNIAVFRRYEQIRKETYLSVYTILIRDVINNMDHMRISGI